MDAETNLTAVERRTARARKSPSRATRSSRTRSSPSWSTRSTTISSGSSEYFEVQPSPNSFEGHHTLRVYNLLAFGALYERIPVHEHVLPIVEGVLDPGCLISSLSSIAILPGETAQPIHADDQLIPLPKPHPPTVCNSMWALTDFTEANGATRLVPGSHLAGPLPRLRQARTTRSRPRCAKGRC